jgi:hypothetical protein
LAAFLVFYFGTSALYYFLIKTTLYEIYNAFTWLPGFVLVAKMSPPEVDLTMMAFQQTIFYSS